MIRLRNGKEMPCLGYGTYCKDADKQALEDRIVCALQAGYRLIDTAWSYGTEETVGRALKRAFEANLVSRDELFIQTKYYPQMPYDHETVLEQFEESISFLGLDYVDAYLIHQPVPRYAEIEYKERNAKVWEAMESLYKKGRVHAIGVSNFLERHIDFISIHAEIEPMINQLEIHPFFQQRGLTDWCHMRGIAVQSWGAMAGGKVMESDLVHSICEKYGKTEGQVCIRWNIQIGNVPIFSSLKEKNIINNRDIEFVISEEDMEQLRNCNTDTEHRDTWWYPRQRMY